MENKRENFDNLVKTLSKSSEENKNSEKISKNEEKTVKISEENCKIFQKFKISCVIFTLSDRKYYFRFGFLLMINSFI